MSTTNNENYIPEAYARRVYERHCFVWVVSYLLGAILIPLALWINFTLFIIEHKIGFLSILCFNIQVVCVVKYLKSMNALKKAIETYEKFHVFVS